MRGGKYMSLYPLNPNPGLGSSACASHLAPVSGSMTCVNCDRLPRAFNFSIFAISTSIISANVYIAEKLANAPLPDPSEPDDDIDRYDGYLVGAPVSGHSQALGDRRRDRRHNIVHLQQNAPRWFRRRPRSYYSQRNQRQVNHKYAGGSARRDPIEDFMTAGFRKPIT